MFKDEVKVTGQLSIVLRDGEGNIKQEFEISNLVVTVGKGVIAARLAGNATPVMSHMAVGTSATAPTVGNTTLGAEVAGSRTALAVAGGTVSGAEVTHTATFGPGVGTGALVEAGLFNASSAGSMLARTTFPAFNKDAPDSLTVIWKIIIN